MYSLRYVHTFRPVSSRYLSFTLHIKIGLSRVDPTLRVVVVLLICVVKNDFKNMIWKVETPRYWIVMQNGQFTVCNLFLCRKPFVFTTFVYKLVILTLNWFACQLYNWLTKHIGFLSHILCNIKLKSFICRNVIW